MKAREGRASERTNVSEKHSRLGWREARCGVVQCMGGLKGAVRSTKYGASRTTASIASEDRRLSRTSRADGGFLRALSIDRSYERVRPRLRFRPRPHPRRGRRKPPLALPSLQHRTNEDAESPRWLDRSGTRCAPRPSACGAYVVREDSSQRPLSVHPDDRTATAPRLTPPQPIRSLRSLIPRALSSAGLTSFGTAASARRCWSSSR